MCNITSGIYEGVSGWSSLAAQTAFFFYIGEGKKKKVVWTARLAGGVGGGEGEQLEAGYTFHKNMGSSAMIGQDRHCKHSS